MRICYVDGAYVPAQDATVSMWDRGYQLSDGVYEVIVFFNHRFLDEEKHIERLRRSLDILKINVEMTDAALKLLMREVIRKNAYRDGSIYVQITRGVAKRGHPFPNPEVKPVVTMAVFPAKQPPAKDVEEGVRVVSVPDLRWQHCDIKSISLLGNVIANQQGVEQGAKEVYMVNDKGFVTEGSLSNSYIVTYDNLLITHPIDDHILNGVRRQNVMRLAEELGIKVEERPFTLEEAKAARESFLTSANTNILPVTTIDDSSIGNGKPGEITLKLLAAYRKHVAEQTGFTP